MAKQSSVNLDITNNADGFDISGGTTPRKLGITGGDVTIAGSGSAVVTFPTTSTTIAGLGITQSFTVLQTFNAGLSASGITVGGLITNISTDSGSAYNPIIDLYRNSASPASLDSIGQIIFNGNDSVGNKQQYVNIHSAILDPSTTVESGQFHIETSTSGAMTEKLRIGAGGLIINHPQGNFNTTIYGQGDTMMFVAQGSTDRIGIGTATPSVKLDVVGSIKASGGLSAGAGSFTGTLTGVTGNFSGLLSASSGLSAAGGVTFSGNFSGATGTFSKLLIASAGLSAGGNVVFNAVTAVFGASAANTTPITLYKDNSADNPAAGDEFTGTIFDTPNNKVPLTLSFTEVYNPDSGLTDTTPGSTMIRVRNQNQNTDNFTVTDLGDIVCGNITCGGIAPTSFGGDLSINGGNSVTLNWNGTVEIGGQPLTVLSVYNSDTEANTLTLNGAGSFSQLTTSGALQYGAAGVLNNSYNLTTGATGATTVASFTKTQYRSFEFDVQGARGTTGPYQFTKILAVHDGTTVTTTQLSNISTGGTAGTYTVDISGTLVRLRVTPGATASTVFKTVVKAIPV